MATTSTGGFIYGANQPFNTIIPANGFNSDSNNPNAPVIKGSIDGQVVAGACKTTSSTNCYQVANWKGLSDLGGWYNGVAATFSTEMALSIDTKIDDGLPLTGIVRNLYLSSTPNGTGLAFDNCHYYGTTYLTNNPGTICILSIGMLSQVGQAQ